MPPKVESLEQLLLLALGGMAWWLGGMVKKWINGFTERRRTEVDRLAVAERKLHYAKETNYALRAAMLKSGQWSLEDLEAFERRREDSPEEP